MFPNDCFTHVYKLTSAFRKEDILLYRLVYAGFFLDAMSPRLPARAHGRSLVFFFFCSRERTINKESFSCSIHVQRNMAVLLSKHTYSAHSFSSHFIHSSTLISLQCSVEWTWRNYHFSINKQLGAQHLWTREMLAKVLN